jgi:hypothetical protein
VALWEDLVDELADLPVDEADRQPWRQLLDVMDSDGDFSATRSKDNRRQSEAQGELLERIGGTIRESVEAALRSSCKDPDIVVTLSDVYREGADSVMVLSDRDNDPLVLIDVANLLEEDPGLRIVCLVPPPPGIEDRMDSVGFEPDGDLYVYIRRADRLRDLAGDRSAETEYVLRPILAAISAGAFDRL